MFRTRLAEVNGGDLSLSVLLTGPFIRQHCLRNPRARSPGKLLAGFGLSGMDRTKRPFEFKDGASFETERLSEDTPPDF